MAYTEQELWIEREDPRDAGKTIRLFGVLRVPEDAPGPLPAVICCHGFTASSKETAPYAVALAEAGLVSVALDFFGGGAEVRSDGTLLDMTIDTEADDLVTFVDAVQALPQVGETRVGLLGCSQGGFVATMVAARIPQRIWSLALMYPAFVLHDDAIRLFPDEADVPESYCQFCLPVTRYRSFPIRAWQEVRVVNPPTATAWGVSVTGNRARVTRHRVVHPLRRCFEFRLCRKEWEKRKSYGP